VLPSLRSSLARSLVFVLAFSLGSPPTAAQSYLAFKNSASSAEHFTSPILGCQALSAGGANFIRALGDQVKQFTFRAGSIVGRKASLTDATRQRPPRVSLNESQLRNLARQEFTYAFKLLGLTKAQQEQIMESLLKEIRIRRAPRTFLNLMVVGTVFLTVFMSLIVYAVATYLGEPMPSPNNLFWLATGLNGVVVLAALFLTWSEGKLTAAYSTRLWFLPHASGMVFVEKYLQQEWFVRSTIIHEMLHALRRLKFRGRRVLASDVTASSAEHLRVAELFWDRSSPLRIPQTPWFKNLYRTGNSAPRFGPDSVGFQLQSGYEAMIYALENRRTPTRFDRVTALQQALPKDSRAPSENYSLSERLGGMAIALMEQYGSETAWRFIRELSNNRSAVEALLLLEGVPLRAERLDRRTNSLRMRLEGLKKTALEYISHKRKLAHPFQSQILASV
jgi:hypothetical protein